VPSPPAVASSLPSGLNVTLVALATGPAYAGRGARRRRLAVGAAAVIPALLIGVLGSTHSQARDIPGYHAPPQDSGLVACSYPLSTQDVSAADYQKVRAEFAASRWPDLRNAGTAYVDLATQLLNGPSSDGYETVWFYQRLSAACAKHGK
jgi:hypothetical protein